MARPGVSYEEVEKIAILIAGEGRIPTIEGVRMRLGTGSSTTLATHLRRWKAGNSDTRQLAMKENLPEEIVQLMKGLWQRLRDESAMQVNAVRQTADRDTSELRATIQQLQQQNNRLTQQNHTILQEKNGLAAQQNVLESLLDELKQENAVLSAKHEGVSGQLIERDTRIMELQNMNRQTQENLEHYRQASLEQRQMDNARHEEERQQLEQAMTQIEEQLESLKQIYGLLQRDHDKLAATEVSLQSQLDQVTVSNAETHAAYERLEAVHAGCEIVSAEIQKKHETMQQIIEQNAHEIRQLESRYILSEQQLTETKASLEDARAQIMLLAQEKWELGQEKGILLGQLKQLAMTVPLAG